MHVSGLTQPMSVRSKRWIDLVRAPDEAAPNGGGESHRRFAMGPKRGASDVTS
jgi:hypothetical protein